MTTDEDKNLSRGCIGQCSVFQQFYAGVTADLPEHAPRTKCFRTREEAEASECSCGKKAFIFAKQGKSWHPKYYSPKGDLSPDAILGIFGFNYIAVHPRTDSKGNPAPPVYTWMNTSPRDPYNVSEGRVSDHPYEGSDYPVVIWCRTCPE